MMSIKLEGTEGKRRVIISMSQKKTKLDVVCGSGGSGNIATKPKKTIAKWKLEQRQYTFITI